MQRDVTIKEEYFRMGNHNKTMEDMCIVTMDIKNFKIINAENTNNLVDQEWLNSWEYREAA